MRSFGGSLGVKSAKHLETIAAAWLARRDGEQWSAADAAELEAWLGAATAHRVAFLRVQSVWQRSNRLKALGAGLPAGTLPAPGTWDHSRFFDQRASAAAAEPVSKRRRFALFARPQALAAVLLLAVALGSAWLLRPAGLAYRTSIGGLASVPLADGSKVTLNTDTSIRVIETAAERSIELQAGEAFFEVAKDPARPFVVHAGGKRVIAVGTQFSVRHDRGGLDVIVAEGQVRIADSSKAKAVPDIKLAAGEIARLRDDEALVSQASLPRVQEALSWRQGFLVFHDTTLATAAAEFNRYNTRKILIPDPQTAAIRIGGNFRVANIEGFVRLLEDSFPIEARRDADAILLTAR